MLYSDAVHREQIAAVLETLEREARNLDPRSREQAVSISLVRLCLLLLGEQPNHWERRALNKARFYRLDRYRSVHFTQSSAQRARFIFDTPGSARFLSLLPKEEQRAVEERYWSAVRSERFGEFVEWFRTSYPERYATLFA